MIRTRRAALVVARMKRSVIRGRPSTGTTVPVALPGLPCAASGLRPILRPTEAQSGKVPRMVRYRRNFVPGGMFFFTVTLDDRMSSVLVDHVDELRSAFRVTRAERRVVGSASRVPSHTGWQLPAHRSAAIIAASTRSGSGDFGNTQFVTMRISSAAPITFTTSRSSTGSLQRRLSGPTARSITTFALVFYLPIGEEPAR